MNKTIHSLLFVSLSAVATASAQAADTSQSTENSTVKARFDKKAVERLCFMLFYGVAGYLTFWVIVLLAIVQFIVTLVSGEPSEDLLRFSRNLSVYMKQICSYLGFVSDEKPCPFSPFPNEMSGSDSSVQYPVTPDENPLQD